MKFTSKKITRRSSLTHGTALTAALGFPSIVPHHVLGDESPSNKVTLGMIGVGAQGSGLNLNMFLQQKDCQVVAVCDVVPQKCVRAKTLIDEHYQSSDCRIFADFRDLLNRPEIDAVCISTPDHWHVPMTQLALKAGKHVICEKPTLTIQEGRELVEAVKQSGKVFTVGLEDRSLIHYHKMAEAVRNGAIGELHTIHVGLPYKKTVYPTLPESPVPEGVNYAMWLGPAPYAPYNANRMKGQVWRQIHDYAAGVLTDWGAHLVDTAQVGNFSENSSPISVEGSGTIPENAMNDVPNQFNLTYTYANGVKMHVESDQPRIRFEGSEGWCGNNGWRGGIEAHDRSIYRRTYKDNKLWKMPAREQRNFLDVIRHGAKPNYDAEALHRLSTTLLIGYTCMQLKRPLQWNPITEAFVDDAEANALRTRPQYTDWENA